MLELDYSIRLVDLFPVIEEMLSVEIWRSDAAGRVQCSDAFFELLGGSNRARTFHRCRRGDESAAEYVLRRWSASPASDMTIGQMSVPFVPQP